MSKRNVWIVGICNTAADGVVLDRVFGTAAEVKKHLVRLVKEDRENDPGAWEYGDLSTDDVDEDPLTGELSVSAVYSRYQIDYTAKPEARVLPVPLDKFGRKMFDIHSEAEAALYNDYMQRWQVRDHNGLVYSVAERKDPA